MSYRPPDNLNAEDQQLEADLVEAYRGIIRHLRDRLSAAEDERALDGWRWRCRGLLTEARASLAYLRREDPDA